jgi:hypothetical protein
MDYCRRGPTRRGAQLGALPVCSVVPRTSLNTWLYLRLEIREVVEARMRARWRLGQLLVKIDRGHGPGRGKRRVGTTLLSSLLLYH